MRFASQLSLAELEWALKALHDAFYRTRDGKYWDPDNEVSGADFVDAAGDVFTRLEMVPERRRRIKRDDR